MMFQQFLNVSYQQLKIYGVKEIPPQILRILKIKANHQKILIAYALYREYMLKFCVVCIFITRLQGEIP